MDGIILIDKPANISSFSVVSKIRHALGIKKCGHAGTLDPFATGLLPILIGKATKLSDIFLNSNKRYIAKIKFGYQTDSLDPTGKEIFRNDFIPKKEDFLNALSSFVGEIEQIPPMFSAIKVGGVRLYKLARQEKEVKIPSRRVNIFSLDLLNYDYENGTAEIEVFCSKGTYIRTLCFDIASSLGAVATTENLMRCACHGFDIKDAIPLEKALCKLNQNNFEDIISLDDALCDFEKYYPDDFFATLLSNGCEIDIKKLKNIPLNTCRVYKNDNLLGLGKIIDKNNEKLFKITTRL